MIFILDRQGKIVNILKNNGGVDNAPPFFDDTLTEDLTTGSETFQFNTIAMGNVSRDLTVGNYVAFKKDGKFKLFQIMQLEETHEDVIYISVYCESAGLELINKVFRRRTLSSATLRMFLDTVINDTGWEVGFVEATEVNSIDLDLEDASVYATLQNNISKFNCELEFRVEISGGRIKGKYIDAYGNRGKVTGKRFVFGQDIEGLTRKTDSTELYTALIGKGNKDINFRDVTIPGIDKPLGQDFVADQNSYERYNHNGYHIMGIFEFDTDSPEELLRETYKQLQKAKEPRYEYEISVALLGELLGEKWNTVSIGDSVAIVDKAFNPPIQLMARVSKLETSFTNPQGDVCTLSNFIEVKSNITNEMRKIASELTGYVDGTISSKFPIGGQDIQQGAVNGGHIFQNSITTDHLLADCVTADKIDAKQIRSEHIDANQIKAEHILAGEIKADHIFAGEIKAQHIDSEQIKAYHIESKTITADQIATGTITAESGIIANASIGNAQIINVDAGKINVGVLNGGLANLQTILTNFISGDSGQFVNLTGSNVVIADAVIKDIIAKRINVEDLSSSNINTNRFNIISDDGGISIVGSTQQFRDSVGNVRLQLGQDALGNFNFILKGADGIATLIDENGIKEGAIADKLIKSDMVDDNAIGREKINYSSFITGLNEGNFELIKSSKILLDETGQSLEIAFNELKTSINYDVEIVSTNGNVFKNGEIATTLMAIVRKGKEDITNTIDANKFRWTRVSNDAEGDIAWNTSHFGGSKQVQITKDDVKVRATFNCEILE